jgi:hypothetical protein
MKILKIERRPTKVRKIVGSDYSINGVQVIAEQGIPHKREYQSDFPDI